MRGRCKAGDRDSVHIVKSRGRNVSARLTILKPFCTTIAALLVVPCASNWVPHDFVGKSRPAARLWTP